MRNMYSCGRVDCSILISCCLLLRKSRLCSHLLKLSSPRARQFDPPSLLRHDSLTKTWKAWVERMAATLPPVTFKNGFSQPTTSATWADDDNNVTEHGEEAHFLTPPSEEPFTSSTCNSLGTNVLRTWPTIFNGTESPHGVPDWWRPSNEIDVLICGGKFPAYSRGHRTLKNSGSWCIRFGSGIESR